MIIGIGTDIIEIKRIEKAIKSSSFLNRCYSEKERILINGNAVTAADNFVVKEAVSKVFGTGLSGIELNEIEVLREESGRPYIILCGKTKRLSDSLNIKKFHVSISNTGTISQAFVIGEGE